MNAIYLISYTNCNEQCVGFAVDFKECLISNTKMDRSGVARHFINKYQDPQNPHAFLKIQQIEQVSVK